MDIHYDLVIAGIVNFLVLVLLFRKFLWDKIVQQIEKRTQLLNKLKKADDEYKKMIEFARKESDNILQKAEKRKKEIVHEAHLLAEQQKTKILSDAEGKAEIIIDDAKKTTARLEKELKDARVDSVKATSKKVVKRLLNHDQELKDEYIWALIKDIQK